MRAAELISGLHGYRHSGSVLALSDVGGHDAVSSPALGKGSHTGATEISVWPIITDAFAEIDRYAARVKTSYLPGDHLELLVVDDDGHEVRRPRVN
jgi:hypothetical protein